MGNREEIKRPGRGLFQCFTGPCGASLVIPPVSISQQPPFPRQRGPIKPLVCCLDIDCREGASHVEACMYMSPQNTHTRTHTRARAHAHTHTHTATSAFSLPIINTLLIMLLSGNGREWNLRNKPPKLLHKNLCVPSGLMAGCQRSSATC